ncbi:MAG: hypothetical protein ABGY10_01950 [bacterium]
MTEVVIQPGAFLSLLDGSGDAPAYVSEALHAPFLIAVYPKNSSPPALPTVSGGVTLTSFFADYGVGDPDYAVPLEKMALSGGGFDTMSSSGLAPNYAGRGVEMTTGTFTDDDYKIGLGTHYEDMMCTFEAPDTGTTVLLGNDNQATSRGKLQIAYTGGAWRFQWVQREAGGSSDVTYTFDTIDVPNTTVGVGATPSPFYLRMLREIPASSGSGDEGQLNLRVNGGTEQSQTITPTARLDTTIATSATRLGGTATAAESNPKVTVFWHRAIWSNTAATVGTLTDTRWATPTIYTTTTYTSNSGTPATGYLDSGVADQYWQAFGFPGYPLEMQGGGRLKARFAPTNTKGGESFSGLPTILQNTAITDLADLQGRYLAMEMQFEIGANWPLAMGAPILSGYSIATAIHDSTTHIVDTIILSVPGEAASGGTLPIRPDYKASVSTNPRSSLSKFETPYSVSYARGTKARRKFSVGWTLTASELATMEAFFLARDGGEQAFTWTAPGDVTTSKAALYSALSIEKLSPNAFRVGAVLEEVF